MKKYKGVVKSVEELIKENGGLRLEQLEWIVENQGKTHTWVKSGEYTKNTSITHRGFHIQDWYFKDVKEVVPKPSINDFIIGWLEQNGDSEYEEKWNGKQDNYELAYDTDDKNWECFAMQYYKSLGTIHFSKKEAESLVEILNKEYPEGFGE